MIDAGLIWIGPPPEAIEALGDKVSARHVAEKVGAPLAPGTADPVADADEVVDFADEHGLPIAIKAAFGGGGRGLKVARTARRWPSSSSPPPARPSRAFGRGECFVEKYLDKPRHVETQCLADQHGNVVVVSTRDCSLQRRHQKLVEEAPAPFLTEEQDRRSTSRPRRSSARSATSAPAPASSSSARTARSRSSRSTPASRSSTPSPRRSPASTSCASSSASPRARSSGTTTPTSAATRSSSASTARTPAATSCPPPAPSPRWHAARRSRRPRRRRLRPGRDHPRRVRLAARQAHRHRPRPHGGARARAPRARRVRGRRHAHRDALPPRRRRRPGVHADDGEPFDVYTRWIETEFDNQIEPYAGELAEARRAGRAQDGRRRGRRQAGSRSACPAGSAACPSATAPPAPKKPKRTAAARPAPRSPATR